jgi:hypothetical protein
VTWAARKKTGLRERARWAARVERDGWASWATRPKREGEGFSKFLSFSFILKPFQIISKAI